MSHTRPRWLTSGVAEGRDAAGGLTVVPVGREARVGLTSGVTVGRDTGGLTNGVTVGRDTVGLTNGVTVGRVAGGVPAAVEEIDTAASTKTATTYAMPRGRLTIGSVLSALAPPDRT